MILRNFGRNIAFAPKDLVIPHDVNDVVRHLERFRGRAIRAVGSLHAWSNAAVGDDVVLDLRRLASVSLERNAEGISARVGAGCTIDRVLAYLQKNGRLTLPTCGIIGAQTMAGALATATHGAGRSSLSHYAKAVRVAAYDGDGRAQLYEWHNGDALRAARCGVGCAGVVVEVTMEVVRERLIEETTRWCDRIEESLEQQEAYPRLQFYLVPWSWRWFGQLRREHENARPSAAAPLLRLLRRMGIDLLWNGTVRLAARTRRGWPSIRWLYRNIFPLIARGGLRVVDHPRHILMMRHDLFRHLEIELFVPEEHVADAAAFVEAVLRWCGGEAREIPSPPAGSQFSRPILEQLQGLRGQYVHDYPITFRRVLKDDTMISMTSGDHAAWYAVSLVTYHSQLEPFQRVAGILAAVMATAFQARPHWGKLCPLSAEDIATLYPELPAFRTFCASVDPQRSFVNDFARRVLGFD